MASTKFTPGARARMIGKVGGLRKWATRTPAQRQAEMARVREGILDKYRAKAAELAPDAAPAEIEEMALRMRRADNAQRAAKATEARIAKRGLSEDKWIEKVHHSAGAYIDKLLGELPFPAEPTDSAGLQAWRANIAKVVYGAVADEIALPHGERSFQRLRKRWEDYRLYLHARVCPTQAPGTCTVCDEAVLP